MDTQNAPDFYTNARSLPTAEKAKLFDSVADDLLAVNPAAAERTARRILKLPTEGTNDKIWLIIIITFALALCGTVLALTIAMFLAAEGPVKPELIFAMFTSIASFLAGLLAPSPFKKT